MWKFEESLQYTREKIDENKVYVIRLLVRTSGKDDKYSYDLAQYDSGKGLWESDTDTYNTYDVDGWAENVVVART